MSSIQEKTHPLRYQWTLFYRPSSFKRGSSSTSKDEWDASCREICTVETVEQYWKMCHNIPKPSMLPVRSTYFIFKKGIQPAWEDPMNQGGGQINIKCPKDSLSSESEIIFFDLMLLIIGNQLDLTDSICGVSFSKAKDLVEVWTKRNTKNDDLKSSILLYLNDMLQLRGLHRLDFASVTVTVRRMR
ncbi:putative eukaryotic translation initiation factor 4E [Monocercomonoides exilis]|uniref:putative eukaryotic translation initiation factor 4E n=1 Tax=Monocercomonoides exilis TaxID=2049356 RepID=UPI00355AA708|nr:putative eukaryotic translation initiation factor 4E [Monocercomonoides exilis]